MPLEFNPSYEQWHASLVVLCRYLVKERGFDADEILAVIEKPWRWLDEYREALEALEAS